MDTKTIAILKALMVITVMAEGDLSKRAYKKFCVLAKPHEPPESDSALAVAMGVVKGLPLPKALKIHKKFKEEARAHLLASTVDEVETLLSTDGEEVEL